MSGLTISEFADRVAELMPVVMKEFIRHQSEEFYHLKMTMPQFFVVEHLSRCGECKMGEIAKFLNVTTAAITGIVDRLVREAYVVRVSDPKDRRIVKIKLTVKGAKVAKDMIELRKKVTIKMFGMISQEEREQYLSILTHIKDDLKE